MQYIPHDYQTAAYNRILETPKIGLFMEMGLGKTVVTLTAIQELMYHRIEIFRVLVVATKKVAEDTWGRESQKWDHLRDLTISKILGDRKHRLEALDAEADIYIIGRDNVKWLVDECRKRKRWKFDTVVIDELSSFKNSQSQRFKAMRSVMPLVGRMIGLTGTPAPNGYMDLWSQMYLLDKGERLGKTIGAYREQYFTAGMRNGYTVFNWNLRKGADRIIQDKIRDICVSMKAEDYLKLPERIDNVIHVRLSEQEQALYDRMEKEQILQMDDETAVVGLSAAAVGNKLLQIANGRVYDTERHVVQIHGQKLEALGEILDCNPHDPVLVFYNFQHDLEAVQEKFGSLAPRTLKTPQDIADWNDGKIRLLMAHPASVGYGLNIQDGGHIIVWYGLTWNLELYAQANARLHRQGQQRSVIINHLVAAGTIDEDVMRALSAKDDMQSALIRAINERREL